MSYPKHILFDIETLISSAQPQQILLIGDQNAAFLDSYLEQKSLLNQPCHITQVASSQLNKVSAMSQRFDVGIGIDLFEHIDKTQGQMLLSKLRDILCYQYCISLPITTEQADQTMWNNLDLYAFGLSRVSTYSDQDNTDKQYSLYKYDINNYKKTPDWLNANNWANPKMWNKYRW